MARTKEIVEYGDFQTPVELARLACRVVSRHVAPASILEPTCGKGHFLIAALETFNSAQSLGLDVNDRYVKTAQAELSRRGLNDRSTVTKGDFFETDWSDLISTVPDPLLVIGNPPWVTNSALGVLRSENLPQKSNFQKHAGFDAKTGKANFDISEWMLVKLLDSLRDRNATLAMLCKTAVARKTLAHAWKHELPIERAEIHGIDAANHFGAAVDACLLICVLSPRASTRECHIFAQLGDDQPQSAIGYRDDQLIANIINYDRLRHLRGPSGYKWRSGIKHDCSRVMEFRKNDRWFINGSGESNRLEPDFLYPMLKSSELANGETDQPKRWMLVTQKSVGDDTSIIEATAPETWKYLQQRAAFLDRRASTIYRNRPSFSIFGVGPYAFAPWKVAISGFYKKLRFTIVGPYDGKPVVLDDTSYFLSCDSQAEADLVCSLLNSDIAADFYSSFIFWDSKRPITVGVLSQLNINALADEMNMADELRALTPTKPQDHQRQLPLA